MKRIAYLVSQYPAPSHTFIRREVLALRRRGIEITTISIRKPDEGVDFSSDDLDEKAKSIYILPTSLLKVVKCHLSCSARTPGSYFRTLFKALSHRPPGIRGLVMSLVYFAEAIIVSKEVVDSDSTHIHNHFANPAAIVGLLCSDYLKIGYSLTLHGLSEFEYPAGLLVGEKISHAKFVPCVSYFTKAQAALSVSYDQWSKLFISRCGIEPDKTIKSNWCKENGEQIDIIAIGRLSREKGLLALLESFKSLTEKVPAARLLLIGDGPEKVYLEEFVRNNNLEYAVSMVGQKPESYVLDAISKSDFLVMTSLIEGLPIVLMESLSAGVPVIAPCVAGIPELVVHNSNGFLYPPSNWEMMEELMLNLASDSKLREKMAKSASENFPPEFCIDQSVNELARRFEDL